MTEANVILANDEQLVLSPLKELLKKNGFTVTETIGSFETLSKLIGQDTDILIASINLSDLDGYKLSCLIKCNEHLSNLPIVLVKEDKNQDDKFWTKAALADSLVNLKDIASGNKLPSLISSLIERSREQGWQGRVPSDNGLNTISFPDKDPDSHWHNLVKDLLIERLIGQLTRGLMDNLLPRTKFLDLYFSIVSSLFNFQAAGLLLANTANPWLSFQVKDGTSKKSFETLFDNLSKEVNSSKELPLDLRGLLYEEDGKALNQPEILYIKGQKTVMGAIIFSAEKRSGFDQDSKAAMAKLQIQMGSIFRLLQANEMIESLHQQEQYRASTDPLTGLYNLEFLVGFLQQQLLFSYRQRSPVSLIIIDIDHLQSVNDRFGYEIGDLVLSTIANRLLNQTRSSDLIARYGGDEFAIVLPNTELNGARVLAEKVRLEVEQMSFVKGPGRKGPHITVSIGCAAFNLEDLNPETILRDSKMALKRAKESGHNRVSL